MLNRFLGQKAQCADRLPHLLEVRAADGADDNVCVTTQPIDKRQRPRVNRSRPPPTPGTADLRLPRTYQIILILVCWHTPRRSHPNLGLDEAPHLEWAQVHKVERVRHDSRDSCTRALRIVWTVTSSFATPLQAGHTPPDPAQSVVEYQLPTASSRLTLHAPRSNETVRAEVRAAMRQQNNPDQGPVRQAASRRSSDAPLALRIGVARRRLGRRARRATLHARGGRHAPRRYRRGR
jgi:hypothetical protein